ncbi:MAG: hypothetical protein K8S23_11265 [Candidatus Cloacimonetes bacterium]|nr:hypothetical protein [Candidatus Cloacimonadota bacterium]
MNNRTSFVYHSSNVKDLKVLNPNVSTHGENWVYATTSLEMSAVFLSRRGGDLTCQVGRDSITKKVFICERFKNSFEYRYDNFSGSIYVLSGEKFIKGKTGWNEEVVCNEKVDVLKEIKVTNIKNYLLSMIEKEKIILVRFPNKIAEIPNDEEDLVYRGIIWVRKFGDNVLDDFKKLHPNIVDRITAGLSAGKYLDNNFRKYGINQINKNVLD